MRLGGFTKFVWAKELIKMHAPLPEVLSSEDKPSLAAFQGSSVPLKRERL
jgi:hypothetical protein